MCIRHVISLGSALDVLATHLSRHSIGLGSGESFLCFLDPRFKSSEFALQRREFGFARDEPRLRW